jgi:hypothetical protein
VGETQQTNEKMIRLILWNWGRYSEGVTGLCRNSSLPCRAVWAPFHGPHSEMGAFERACGSMELTTSDPGFLLSPPPPWTFPWAQGGQKLYHFLVFVPPALCTVCGIQKLLFKHLLKEWKDIT